MGEHFACLTFRKVANWYSRVLRPGRELHRRMMLLDSVAAFDQIGDELRERGDQRGHGEETYDAWSVPVPAGPQEKW